MFVARAPICVSRPGFPPLVLAVGEQVVGFENWPMPSREAALASGRVEDTHAKGARGTPGGRPPGVAGRLKDYRVRIFGQRRDPHAARWRFGESAEAAPAAEQHEETLACLLCGKVARSERGLKIHMATAHRAAK